MSGQPVRIRCECGRTLHLLHHRTREPLNYPVGIGALRNGVDFAGECRCGIKWRFGVLPPTENRSLFGNDAVPNAR